MSCVCSEIEDDTKSNFKAVLSADRMNICSDCEWFRASLKQCKKCMCFMPAKTRINSAKCPLGKW